MQWASMRREKLKESWARGEFTASLNTEMVARNAAATGAASIYEELLNLTYEDLEDDTDGE